MSKFLTDIIKSSGSDYVSIAADGTESDITGYVDTGSYAFNGLLSADMFGGVANNKVLGLAGAESTGKTWFALSMVSTFLRDNPTGAALYFDTESTISKQIIESRGIDSDRVAVFGVDTIESFETQINKILDKYLATPKAERIPLIIVLDSLGNMPSTKEMEIAGSDKKVADMTRPKIIKRVFRTITLKLGRAKIGMIVTNHTYTNIGQMYAEDVMAGGGGLKYAASSIVFFSKRKNREDEGITGVIIRCKLKKGRETVENKEVEVLLHYAKGLDKYFGLLPIAEKYGIFKKVSTRFELPDGRKVFGKNILDNPEEFYTPEVMEALNKAVKEEFSYGSDFVDTETGEEIEKQLLLEEQEEPVE